MSYLIAIPDEDLVLASATPKYPLGTLYELDGNTYRYVKVTDAVDVTIGMSLSPSTSGGWYVTPDRAGGTAVVKARTTSSGYPIAGIALGSVDVSEEPYCWIQVAGLCTYILTDGNFTASELVEGIATDGTAGLAIYETDFDPSDTTVFAFGVTYEADTGTVGSAYLTGCVFK